MTTFTFDLLRSYRDAWNPREFLPSDSVIAAIRGPDGLAPLSADPVIRSLVESLMAGHPKSTRGTAPPMLANCRKSWARLVAATTHTEYKECVSPAKICVETPPPPSEPAPPPSDEEHHARFKTKLCRHYMEMGSCPYMTRKSSTISDYNALRLQMRLNPHVVRAILGLIFAEDLLKPPYDAVRTMLELYLPAGFDVYGCSFSTLEGLLFVGGGRGKAETQLAQPRGVAVVSEHVVVVADEMNRRLAVWLPLEGTCLYVVDLGRVQPCGVAVLDASEGLVAVTDTAGHAVVLVNWRTSVVMATFGTGTELEKPSGLCAVTPTTLVVCDTTQNRLQVLDTASGEFSPRANFITPREITAIDGGKLVAVTDGWRCHRVSIADWAAGTVLRRIGNGRGGGLSQLYNPLGIVAVTDDVLAVADQSNCRIQFMHWREGKFLRSLACPSICRPYGMVVLNEITLVITDEDNHKLLLLS